MIARCSHSRCKSLPASVLQGRRLCQAHFISACYRRLDELGEVIRRGDFQPATHQSIRKFLFECTSQATSRALRARELSNAERSQLLNIVLSAGDLLSKLRRSSRMIGFIPVRLSETGAKPPWIEETVTQLLSKHGAMFRCTRPYAKGQPLELERLDTRQRAIARVVWQRKETCGLHEIGVEILNSVSFWNQG